MQSKYNRKTTVENLMNLFSLFPFFFHGDGSSNFALVSQCHYSLIIMHENPVQFLVQNCCDLELLE